ncbi:MAG: 50S ribosomal protein L21e [Candidatus Thermoplasmatota archaeon]|nr:50S ribosomal protein L21e [Candidatus Thermoplasmatota archaeon]
MVKASKGPRRRTRQKFRKRPRDRGPPPVTHFFTPFVPGEKAAIVIDPSIHKGQPNKRYHGLTGTVEERRGRAYVVAVRQGGLIKRVIATPEHLRKVG